MHSSVAPRRYSWRIVDIVVASVIGVAASLIFVAWNTLYAGPWKILSTALPGSEGLVNGVWLFAGVFGALIIRKPGAALYIELLASIVSGLIGNQWGGFATILIGIVQGLGAEIGFALFGWKVWNFATASFAGALTGVGCAAYSLVGDYAGYAAQFKWLYMGSSVVSGFIIAGMCSWLLMKAVAKTGALSKFAAGRTVKPSA